MTDELKKALESAKTEEELTKVAEEYKNEIIKLSDEELEEVVGGVVVGTVEGKKFNLTLSKPD